MFLVHVGLKVARETEKHTVVPKCTGSFQQPEPSQRLYFSYSKSEEAQLADLLSLYSRCVTNNLKDSLTSSFQLHLDSMNGTGFGVITCDKRWSYIICCCISKFGDFKSF